jgi:hypothetical protein
MPQETKTTLWYLLVLTLMQQSLVDSRFSANSPSTATLTLPHLLRYSLTLTMDTAHLLPLVVKPISHVTDLRNPHELYQPLFATSPSHRPLIQLKPRNPQPLPLVDTLSSPTPIPTRSQLNQWSSDTSLSFRDPANRLPVSPERIQQTGKAG